MAEQSTASILALDCGAVLTKAVLLDRVNGTYRFIARGEALTTVKPPWQDIAIGAQAAIEQVEDVTGRTLLNDRGNLITPQRDGLTGVDAFLVVSSAAPPIPVMVAGLVPEMSLASLLRAVAGTYSTVKGTIVHDPLRGMSTEEQVRRILDSQAEVVCISGGTDGGAAIPTLELVEATALACSMLGEGERPLLLYAGNSALRKRVVNIISGAAELRAVDNVRPALEVENYGGVQSELDALYREKHLNHMAGVELLTHWSRQPILPSAEAFARVVRYLWYLDESPKGTLGIDVGGFSTTVAAVFEGYLHLTIRADLGSAYGARALVERNGAASIMRWLPTPMPPETALSVILNKEIHPSSVPDDPAELWIEQAVARETIREALKTARPGWKPGKAQPYGELTPLFDPILISGGILAGAPRPGHVALMVLDAVEPIGITTLLLDANGLAPILGAVASFNPLATVETLDHGGVINLATVIAPVGFARKGDVVLRVRVNYEEGGSLDVEVPYGSLELLPLPPGEEAVLELEPRRRFDVGLGGPGKGGKQRVRGGILGLIVDARGRPLQLPDDPEEQQAQNQQWLWDVGG